MSSLSRRRSRPSASTISTSFAASVRGRRSSRRTVCIVRVEAPETMRRLAMNWPTARATSPPDRPRGGCRTGDPRRRPACAGKADRRDRRRAAGATCRPRSESRAGSSRHAPEPAPTDRGCGRAPGAAGRTQMRSAQPHRRRDHHLPPPAGGAGAAGERRTISLRRYREPADRGAAEVSGSYMSSTTSAG